MKEIQILRGYQLLTNFPSTNGWLVNYSFTPTDSSVKLVPNTTSMVGGSGFFNIYLGRLFSLPAVEASIDASLLTNYILTHFGYQLASMLAKVLDELEKHDREAIHPIVSVLEPYMKADQSFTVNIQPKSSKEVNINITRAGKVIPKIYLDESQT